jgi:phospholipid/cholesterol/gamma-HCH transport system substrate-binding protein
MNNSLGPAVSRLAVFVTVCLVALFGLIAVFGQVRFQDGNTYRAEFASVSGLKAGNFVRVAGVEVGKVKSISITPGVTAIVEFTTDTSVTLTHGSRAVVRYQDMIGGRYLALDEGAGGTAPLRSGDTIPLDRTAPALDLDSLIGGFRPLFRALDPDQINSLSGQLIKVFQGQGETIGSFLGQTAALTNALADRDQLIGQVVNNLSVTLKSVGEQSRRLDKAVVSLSDLVAELASRRGDITDSVAYGDAAAASVADLLSQSRAPLNDTITQTDRTAGIVVADHDYVDNLINTLPDAYQKVSRLGLYGDFFSFYLCELVLKMNGKGGQPVYVKLAEQSSGRCTPK